MLSKILHDLGNEEFCPTDQSMQRCNPHSGSQMFCDFHAREYSRFHNITISIAQFKYNHDQYDFINF